MMKAEREDRYTIDWDKQYDKYLKTDARLAEDVASGRMTKAQVIASLKQYGSRIVRNTQGRDRAGSRIVQDTKPKMVVKDPAGYRDRDGITSGPQPGTRLPAFTVFLATNFKQFDPFSKTEGRPHALLFVREDVSAIQCAIKTHEIIHAANKSQNQKVQTTIVVLSTHEKQVDKFLSEALRRGVILGDANLCYAPADWVPPTELKLNSKSKLTAIMVKEGVVTHSFAFSKPVRTPHPQLLGGIVNLMAISPTDYSERTAGVNMRSHKNLVSLSDLGHPVNDDAAQAALQKLLFKLRDSDKISADLSNELFEIAFPVKLRSTDADYQDNDDYVTATAEQPQVWLSPEAANHVERLLNDELTVTAMKQGRLRKFDLQLSSIRRSGNRRFGPGTIYVKDPKTLYADGRKRPTSGPQPGMQLPKLKVIGLHDKYDAMEYDPTATASNDLHILMFLTDIEAAVAHLRYTPERLKVVEKMSRRKLHYTVVFHDNEDRSRAALRNFQFLVETQRANFAYVPKDDDFYGIDKPTTANIVVVDQGKVIHSLAYNTALMHNEPHLMGAVADALHVKYQTLADWNYVLDATREGVRQRQRDRNFAKRKLAFTNALKPLVSKDRIKQQQADKLIKAAFPAEQNGFNQ